MSAAIALEPAGGEVRLAVATRRRRGLTLSTARHPAGSPRLAAMLETAAARRPRAVVGVLPLSALAHRLLALPFTDTRRLAQVVPLELQGQLPADPPDAVTGWELLARDAEGARVLAALVRRRDVDALAATAAPLGLRLTAATAAPLALRALLPPAFDGGVLIADPAGSSLGCWRRGIPHGLHSLAASPLDGAALAAEVRWAIARLDAGAAPLVVVGPAAAAAEAGLRAAGLALGPAADVLVGVNAAPAAMALEFAPVAGAALAALEQGARSLFELGGAPAAPHRRRMAGLAAAAALLTVLDLGLVQADLARREATLREAIGSEAARALGVDHVVAPRAQLEAAASARRRAAPAYGSVLARLREVSGRVPAGLPVDLERLTIEDDLLQLVGEAPTFEAVDVLRRALAASPRLADVATDEVRTTVDGSRVSFRLRGRWLGLGGTPS